MKSRSPNQRASRAKAKPLVDAPSVDAPKRSSSMKILITVNTRDEHGQFGPGDVIELDDEEAKKYIEQGWGVETDQEVTAPKK